jgi:glycosyl transferase family 2
MPTANEPPRPPTAEELKKADEIVRRFEERAAPLLAEIRAADAGENLIPFPAPAPNPPEGPLKAAEAPAAAEGLPPAPAAQDGQKTAGNGPPADLFPAGFGRWENAAYPDYWKGGKKPWFSLAAIMANEEHHIERFIRTFEPLVDEIVLLRAIGNQKPDQTFEIAAQVATKPLLLAEYRNHPDLDWPHVDDFAKARQAAFDLAQGEFIMWADADDVIDDESAKKLRGEVDIGNFDVLFMQYRVMGAPTLVRERVLRKGIGHWCNPVHEAVSFSAGFKRSIRLDIEVFHLPVHDGTGKPKGPAGIRRNLRILEHAIEPAALNYFYLHRDSMLVDDLVKAVDWAKMAIASPNLTPAEKYRVHYNCAMIFLGRNDFQQAETFAMNGMRLCPDRRECFCVMATIAIEQKNWRGALHWIQIAKCLQAPQLQARPNWFADDWYSWRADLTHSFALRKLGLREEAQAVDDFEHGGRPIISLLHATRGRPQAAVDARDRFFSLALKPGMIEHIFAVDTDDKESLSQLDGFNVVLVEPGGGCVRAWNAAAAASRGKVLVQMSDDWQPPYHWDNQILWAMKTPVEKSTPAVLAISDGIRSDKLLCMAILTRAQYLTQRHERTGEPYLFHPEYLGVYSDNEFTVRAYENGVVIEAKGIVFKHEHPLATGAPLDATYRAQNSPERYAHGLEVFNRRNPRYKIELKPAPASVDEAIASVSKGEK